MSADKICFPDVLGPRGGLSGVLAQVLEQDDELVSAEAGDGVAVGCAGGEPPGDLDQQLVADVVAAGLVEDLEIVEIDEQERPFSPAAPAARQRLLQTVQEQATVGQLGQGIVVGQMLDLLFRRLALGDVDQRADVVGYFATLAPDRRDVEPCGKSRAAFAPVPDFPLPGSLAGDAIPYRPVKGGVVPVRLQHARRPPHDLFARIARDFGIGPIDAQDPLVGIGDDDSLLRLESGGGDPELLFGLAAFRNVSGDAENAD